MTENVVIKFEADTSGLDATKKKLDELNATQKKGADQFKKSQEEEAKALIKTNGALNVLEANLKSLYADRQKAFDAKSIREFNIQIAEGERAIQKLKSAGTEAKKGFEGFGSSLKDLAVAFGLAFSIEKVVEFGKASIEAFKEAEKAAKDLEFAVKNIGKEGDAAVAKLKDLAVKLSSINNASIFDDDEIIKAETALTTFGLTSAEIEKLLPNLVDVASVTGDLAGTTETFIQAINGQTRGLKQLGIDFKDTGDKLENFNILTEKSEKFTGQAAAALETAAGQAKAYDNAIGNLQESIGERLVPILGKLKLALLEVASDVVDSFRSDEALLSDIVKKSNAAQLQRFIGYSAELRKAAVAANAEDAKDQLRIIADYKNRTREELDIAKAKLAAALQLQKDYLNALSPNTLKSKLGLTEEEQAKRDEAARKLQAAETQKNKLNELLLYETISVDFSNKSQADGLRRQMSANDKLLDAYKALLEKQFAADEKYQRQVIDSRNEAILTSAQNLSDALFQIGFNGRQEQLDNELEALEKQRESEISAKGKTEKQKADIQAKYDKEEARIKTEAAKRQRDADISQALINGALAITKTYAETGFTPAGIAAAIAQGIATALQVAVIDSQPLPKYAKGKEYIDGPGTATSDSILARLSKGERVVPSDVNDDYFPALSAIHNRRISPVFANNLLTDLPRAHALENIMRANKNGNGIDYIKLARALGGELTGLDDLRKLDDTNKLLYQILNKGSNSDIRRN